SQRSVLDVVEFPQKLLAQRRLLHSAHTLVQRQLRNGLVARAVGKDVPAALKADQYADAAGRHLGTNRQALLDRLGSQLEQPAPALLVAMLLHQRERQGAARD